MKGKYPLTRARLHRALLELLQHPEVRVDLAAMRDAGRAEWDPVFPPTNIRIKVDANDGDDLRTTIHELLHVVLHPVLVGRVDETIEEVMVVALDDYIWKYVNASADRERTWRNALRKKAQEGLVEVPHEKLVERREQ